MVDRHSENVFSKIVGPPIGATVGVGLSWLTAPSTGVSTPGVATLLASLGGVIGFVLLLIYRRYLGVLGSGAKRKGSPERAAYDRLRENLSGGNLAARLYAQQLKRLIDGIDRFFGDVGMANRTLFPRAFGLNNPAPLWTPQALDRCLFLAFVYPVATIFII